MKRLAMFLVFGLILVVGVPSTGWAQAIVSNNSEVPGSVLIFPKFLTGTVVGTGGVVLPRSSFEISVVCPADLAPFGCLEMGQIVRLRAHWVCPGIVDPDPTVCRETDFKLQTTVNGTLFFSPGNVGTPDLVTAGPPCPQGYLIVWVIDDRGRPIAFDGLVGDAILRHSGSGAGGYNAIPIQALSGTPSGTLTDPTNTGLKFDGSSGYNAVTGRIFSSVRFENPVAGPTGVQTDLTLLTLDVLSNRFNTSTFVGLDFYNRAEEVNSTFAQFVCWGEFRLTDLDPNQTQTGRNSIKGLLRSSAASDPFGSPRTLLGLVETLEGPVGASTEEYSYSLYNDGVPVPTTFFPFTF